MKVGDIVYLKNDFHYLVKIRRMKSSGIYGDYKVIYYGEPDKEWMHMGTFLWNEIKEIKVLS